jgi:hypothetical protein
LTNIKTKCSFERVKPLVIQKNELGIKNYITKNYRENVTFFFVYMLVLDRAGLEQGWANLVTTDAKFMKNR